MVKLVEELTSDLRAGRTKPGRKLVENAPGRLLFPEKHLKQTKLHRLYRFEKRKKSAYILNM